MNPFAILFVVAAASASALPVLPVLSQYHAQDELGQYSYGYAGGPSSKHETKTADGITRGGFSYIDSNGLIQSRSYVSDPVNGFRVAASDVPDGHPVALVAPAASVAAPAPVISSYSAAAPVVSTYSSAAPVVSTYSAAAPVVSTYSSAAPVVSSYSAAAPVVSTYSSAAPVVSTYSAAAPVVSSYSVAAPVVSTYSAAAPVVVPATSTVVAAGTHSQYHSQDALGQYRYGYSGGSSAKEEQKTADGITRGAFSYIDSHGLVQTRSYVADDVYGFRVAASDLPVGPAPVPAESAPAAPVASVPVAPVVSLPVAPVASIPVAPVDSSAQPAAPAAPSPAQPAEAPVSDASSDSVIVDSA